MFVILVLYFVFATARRKKTLLLNGGFIPSDCKERENQSLFLFTSKLSLEGRERKYGEKIDRKIEGEMCMKINQTG